MDAMRYMISRVKAPSAMRNHTLPSKNSMNGATTIGTKTIVHGIVQVRNN